VNIKIFGLRIVSDRTYREEFEEVQIDGRTGLPGKSLTDRALNALDRKTDYALLFIDVNKLGEINRLYDHFEGNKVIEAVGLRLAGQIRETDFAGHWTAGDEFIIILHDITGPLDVRVIVDRIVGVFNAPIRELQAPLSVSIGVALCAGSVTNTLAEAMNAQKIAKLDRNTTTVVFANPKLSAVMN